MVNLWGRKLRLSCPRLFAPSRPLSFFCTACPACPPPPPGNRPICTLSQPHYRGHCMIAKIKPHDQRRCTLSRGINISGGARQLCLLTSDRRSPAPPPPRWPRDALEEVGASRGFCRAVARAFASGWKSGGAARWRVTAPTKSGGGCPSPLQMQAWSPTRIVIFGAWAPLSQVASVVFSPCPQWHIPAQ